MRKGPVQTLEVLIGQRLLSKLIAIDSSVARDNVTDFSGGVIDKLRSQRFLWLLSNTPLLQSSRQSLPISASMDGQPTSSSGSSESMFVTMI
jgi:hypothetical protein